MNRHYPLIVNFQKKRWSLTRAMIHDMPVGYVLGFRNSEFANISTTITRLQEAYRHTRAYRMRRFMSGWVVQRLK